MSTSYMWWCNMQFMFNDFLYLNFPSPGPQLNRKELPHQRYRVSFPGIRIRSRVRASSVPLPPLPAVCQGQLRLQQPSQCLLSYLQQQEQGDSLPYLNLLAGGDRGPSRNQQVHQFTNLVSRPTFLQFFLHVGQSN